MQTLSQTEENYLKAIFHLSEHHETVSTNALANSMSTTPASVNDMMKRLSTKGLISHVKYKGANITPKGHQTAAKIIRKHRLWEVFLVNVLNFHWDEVHDIAEQLEHVKSTILTDRLDAFLNHPKFDPHGDPIPDKDGNFKVGPSQLLSEMASGESGVLVGVGEDDPKLLKFLDGMKLRLGTEIAITERIEFDGSFEIQTENNAQLFISSKVADLLIISKSNDND